MAECKTAEQVRDDHLRVLGPDLGALYHALHDEVIWLHGKWQQYRILFAESEERIELLNGVAGFFFRVIQDVLFENVVLHIARLTDPTQSVGKDNLTLFRLAEFVKEPKLALEVKSLAERAKAAATFARDWRNRHLAHTDLALALGDQAKPLPPISRERIDAALAAAALVLNRIESHYWQSEVAFTQVIQPLGDAESLAHYLRVAIDVERPQ